MLAGQGLLNISHWSTDSVAPEDRGESVIQALERAIVPVSVSIDDPSDFEFHMSRIDLDDGISVLHQAGSSHRSSRGQSELAKSDAHTFHFLINLKSGWEFNQNEPRRIGVGEGALVDSAYVHELGLIEDFEIVHVMMQEEWLRRWVSQDVELAGHTYPIRSGMGAALNFFAAQLCPKSLVNSPLSSETLADKFGALLAMASQQEGSPCKSTMRTLSERIQTDIIQRCAEPNLCPTHIAQDLHVSEMEVHCALMMTGLVFGNLLTKARCDAATRMVTSPSFSKIPTEEVAARAGFSDTQTMLQVLRTSARRY